MCEKSPSPSDFFLEVFARQGLGQTEALSFISSASRNISPELSYLYSKIKETLLSQKKTPAPESLIFILEIIKTSILSKRLLFRQLSPLPWIVNLKYVECLPTGSPSWGVPGATNARVSSCSWRAFSFFTQHLLTPKQDYSTLDTLAAVSQQFPHEWP